MDLHSLLLITVGYWLLCAALIYLAKAILP